MYLSSEVSGDRDYPLQLTIAPWKIAPDHSGKLTKIFAMRGKVRQYGYNTGHDASEWHPSWQRGYVCSPWSGRIVLDRDADGFEELLARCGIPVSPFQVLTGRPGGYQLHYDGRFLLPGDWPTQRTLYGPDGAQIGDVKSHGFVPCPGSIHPNGTRYRMAPGSGGLGDELPWLPAYTRALIEDQEALGRHSYGSFDRGATGSGRNNELYELKKKLFYEEGLGEGDRELHRRVYEANDQFETPLDEEEVRLTVLQHKGWKRHWTLITDDPEFSAGSDEVTGPAGGAAQSAGALFGMSDSNFSFPGDHHPEDDLESPLLYIKPVNDKLENPLTCGFTDRTSAPEPPSPPPPSCALAGGAGAPKKSDFGGGE